MHESWLNVIEDLLLNIAGLFACVFFLSKTRMFRRIMVRGESSILARIAMAVLWVAAVLGDQCNYSIGRYFGPKVFQWEDSRLFNKKAFDKAHNFYERYGGITIVLARFMPFIRTFVPFVAGVAEMSRAKFTFYNVLGATIWVGGIVVAGYLFGNIPWVQQNLQIIIWGLILVPGLIALYGAWKAGRADKAQVTQAGSTR